MYPSRVNVDRPSPYEVYCQRCRVSFPVGTRPCIHCGERIGRPGLLRAAPARPAAAPKRPAGAPPPPVFEEDAEELPTRGGLMSPVAILWVVLILGGAIYRACS